MMKVPLPKVFSQRFQHEDGWTFTGTLQNIKDQKIYNDDYFPIRQILRVEPSCLVRAGSVVQAENSVRFLLGELEEAANYRGFRCYPVNERTDWTRSTTVIDPFTQQPRASGSPQVLGRIWVLSEMVIRENRGGDIQTREEVYRVLTGASVQLNDTICGKRVQKVNVALGVRVLELS